MYHYIAHCEHCNRDIFGQAEQAPKSDEFPCPYCGGRRVEVIQLGLALTLDEAIAAIDAGKPVWWQHYGYRCGKDRHGWHYCTCVQNNSTVGLAGCERGLFTDLILSKYF